MIEVDELAAQYRDRGFALASGMFRVQAHHWGRVLLGLQVAGLLRHVKRDQRGGGQAEGYETSETDYHALDGRGIARRLGSVLAAYEALLPTVARVAGCPAVLSPYERSAVTALVYTPPGGFQGWHRDTNGITVIVYCTDNTDGETELVDLKGERHLLKPELGAALFMQGRLLDHCGRPVAEKVKICMPWNYYHQGDTARPAGLDEDIYG